MLEGETHPNAKLHPFPPQTQYHFPNIMHPPFLVTEQVLLWFTRTESEFVWNH